MKNDNKLKILAVDIKPENLITLEAFLETQDCELVRAFSGKEALERVLENDYFLILLNAQTPDVDGFETAELIRGIEQAKLIPIIFVTTFSKEIKFSFKGYQTAAVDYILEPIDEKISISKIRVFIDLYEQKRLIKLQAAQLEKMTTDFKAGKLGTDKFSPVQTKSFSDMSHDLRTPLTSILGFSELLGNKHFGPLNEKQEEYVKQISANGKHLQSLIDDLLETAKSRVRTH